MREQVAVFVNAIYLYAFGSVALTGTKLPRVRVGVNTEAFLAELAEISGQVAAGRPILRVYWYDVVSSNRFHEDAQLAIGGTDSFKFRPVGLHNQIVKTGIESMMMKDATELAEHGAVSDVVFIARNDLLRPGVDACQARGVRVHLLEIFRDSYSTYSRLQTDADTCRSWGRAELGAFLFEQDLPQLDSDAQSASSRNASYEGGLEADETAELIVSDQAKAQIHRVVDNYIERLYEDQIEQCVEYWQSGRTGVPSEHDKGLLTECRMALDRTLENNERYIMRTHFRKQVSAPNREAEADDQPAADDEFDYDDEYLDEEYSDADDEISGNR